MKAEKIEHRKLLRADGSIIEIKVWRLPPATPEWPHGLKYSLYYGRAGERIVGYDNEAGNGDHRHLRGRQEAYRFVSFEQMLRDFRADVEREENRDD